MKQDKLKMELAGTEGFLIFFFILVAFSFLALGIASLVRDFDEAWDCHDNTIWIYLLLTLCAIIINTPLLLLFYKRYLNSISLLFVMGSQCWLPLWGIVDLVRGNDKGCPNLTKTQIYSFSIFTFFLHNVMLLAWIYVCCQLYFDMFPSRADSDSSEEYAASPRDVVRIHKQSVSGDYIPSDDEDTGVLRESSRPGRVKFKESLEEESIPNHKKNSRSRIPLSGVFGDEEDSSLKPDLGRNESSHDMSSKTNTTQINVILDDCVQGGNSLDTVVENFILTRQHAEDDSVILTLSDYLHTHDKSANTTLKREGSSNTIEGGSYYKLFSQPSHEMINASTSSILTLKGCKPSKELSSNEYGFILNNNRSREIIRDD